MSKTVLVGLLATFFLASVSLAEAQQPGKIPRIVLTRPEQSGSPVGEALIEAFRQGLRERGYVEGQNIALEILWLGGGSGPIPKRLTDSTRPKADFIITSGTASTRAAQKATSTIPIIMASTGADPVAEGFVASLARPGGNITGLTNMSIDLAGKRLELLKETVPKSSRVAVLLDPSRPRAAEVKEIQDAAHALGVQVQSPTVKGPDDFKNAFRSASKGRADALMIVSGGVFNAHRSLLTELAAKSRLPAMYSEHEYVYAGGLMVYASVLTDQYRRAAVYVDKILKGAKPADLPVEQPVKFEFIVNLKTAKQIRLTIPPNVLARADKVIR
jgi:putative tryptophan/tyrosine transport system substrate-binding protein